MLRVVSTFVVQYFAERMTSLSSGFLLLMLTLLQFLKLPLLLDNLQVMQH